MKIETLLAIIIYTIISTAIMVAVEWLKSCILNTQGQYIPAAMIGAAIGLIVAMIELKKG